MPVCIRSHQVSQGSFQRESFADLPCWILCAKLFLHDFEYQQHYEADEEVRLDTLRERRRRHRHALQQRQETDKSTATRSRLQLTPDNVGGQAIVRHAPRERRRWQPPFRQRQGTGKSTATRSRLQLTPDNVGGQAIVRHAPRERRRWQPPFRQRQGTGKSTATRSRLQLTPDNVGGQAIVWHAPRERRRWHWHAPTHLHFRLRFGKENRASSFLSTHLALSFQKIGCGSETQNQINLFCASLILHYLCSYFHF